MISLVSLSIFKQLYQTISLNGDYCHDKAGYPQPERGQTEYGEKRRVLSGLATAKSRGALEMAMAYLDDATLSREAEFATVKIAEGIQADFPDLAKDTLKTIIERTKNDTLRARAQEVLDKME